MNPLDLAIAAGAALTAGWLVFWLRRRRPSARLARLTRAASAASSAASAASSAVGVVGAVGGGSAPGPAVAGSALGRRARAALLRRPVAASGAVAAVLSGAALLLAGPVAAVVAAMYSLMALVSIRRSLIQRNGERLVAALLDAIDSTAEGLRAGIVVDGSAAAAETSANASRRPGPAPGSSGEASRRGGTALGVGETVARPGPTGRPGRRGLVAEAAAEVARARLDAAYRLSGTLGVPLADLLDRVDADLRAGQALRGGVAAQLSAAQATAAVLLTLPLAGLWVGAALGTRPVHQLLHTPLGAACAVVAVALQCLGFLWTSRMVHAATAEVR